MSEKETIWNILMGNTHNDRTIGYWLSCDDDPKEIAHILDCSVGYIRRIIKAKYGKSYTEIMKEYKKDGGN